MSLFPKRKQDRNLWLPRRRPGTRALFTLRNLHALCQELGWHSWELLWLFPVLRAPRQWHFTPPPGDFCWGFPQAGGGFAFLTGIPEVPQFLRDGGGAFRHLLSFKVVKMSLERSYWQHQVSLHVLLQHKKSDLFFLPLYQFSDT